MKYQINQHKCFILSQLYHNFLSHEVNNTYKYYSINEKKIVILNTTYFTLNNINVYMYALRFRRRFIFNLVIKQKFRIYVHSTCKCICLCTFFRTVYISELKSQSVKKNITFIMTSYVNENDKIYM